ncbi:hypothetical protein Tco_0502160 [Tanacetum coccineum]
MYEHVRSKSHEFTRLAKVYKKYGENEIMLGDDHQGARYILTTSQDKGTSLKPKSMITTKEASNRSILHKNESRSRQEASKINDQGLKFMVVPKLFRSASAPTSSSS